MEALARLIIHLMSLHPQIKSTLTSLLRSCKAAVKKNDFCFSPPVVGNYFSVRVVHFLENWIESFYLLPRASLQSFVKHLLYFEQSCEIIIICF